MDSPMLLPIDDKDLDDDALWAQVDTAATNAASNLTTTNTISSARLPKLPNLKHSNFQSPQQVHSPSPPPRPRVARNPRYQSNVTKSAGALRDIGAVDENSDYSRPTKLARPSLPEVAETGTLTVVKQVHQSPRTPITSPDPVKYTVKEMSPFSGNSPLIEQCEDKEKSSHSLSGKFTSVSLFKEYQNVAMSILEKSDYLLISGHPFIKKSGWRKLACYFNVSFEIKDRVIEYDETRNVLRAEFMVRAHMQVGRFSDGWGSCDRREKRFNKPNHDIPSTAETRAKNKACQDLLGIGEYRPGKSHSHAPR